MGSVLRVELKFWSEPGPPRRLLGLGSGATEPGRDSGAGPAMGGVFCGRGFSRAWPVVGVVSCGRVVGIGLKWAWPPVAVAWPAPWALTTHMPTLSGPAGLPGGRWCPQWAELPGMPVARCDLY